MMLSVGAGDGNRTRVLSLGSFLRARKMAEISHFAFGMPANGAGTKGLKRGVLPHRYRAGFGL